MKRLFALLMTLCLLGGALSAASADSPMPLPQGIVDALSGLTIMDYTSYDNGKEEIWFVAARRGNENVLYCFAMKNGAWKEKFHNDSAIPKTANANVNIYLEYDGINQKTGRRFGTPVLMINVPDADDTVFETRLAYGLNRKGNWELMLYASIPGNFFMLFEEGSITYYYNYESEYVRGKAEGDIQLDLRYISVHTIPKTLSAAQSKLTVAPTLPASTELHEYPVTFTGKQKYEVYSAPDKSSIRGANGKAAVSTNSWIQVFGREGDWILVQYSIDTSHYRFGYISAKALPKNTDVPQLAFHRTNVWSIGNVNLTDDPLYSRTALAVIPDKTPLTWLATLGEWAYVELTLNGQLTRGFIPANAITADSGVDLGSFKDSQGRTVFNGTLNVTYDGRIEVSLTVAPDGPLAGADIDRVEMWRGDDGMPLAVLYRDEAGTYFCNVLPGTAVSAVILAAIDVQGTDLALVNVNW